MPRIEETKNSKDGQSLTELELKANLNPEQRAYLGILKDKMKKILAGKTKQELAKAGDLVSLNKYRAVLVDILEFLKTKEMPINDLIFTTPEGKEIKIEMVQQLKYWGEFYREQGIDWITMPAKIELTAEDHKELTKGAQALCPDGNYEKLKMLIIPAGLADNGEKYGKLHEKMTEGYRETWQSDNIKADGSFEGQKNKSDKLRIMLVKDIQNLKDDEVYAQTLNRSVVKPKDKSIGWLEGEGGLFEQTGLMGIDAAVYLVWQREYFERTKKHLDAEGWIWLTENRRPPSGRVANSCWHPANDQLFFVADDPDYHRDGLGCRLSSSREK